jgi:ankyrin repeat protein
MQRLIDDGVNVNAKGKGNMTPLLWAYPDNKLERFELLLKHGADPNVIIESDFNTRGGMGPGDSVTHFACKSSFPGYFEAVFNHGGNPNLINPGKGNFDDSPLLLTIKFGGANKSEKIRTLLKMGAEINYMNDAGKTPVRQAVTWGGQYDLALTLLDAGADPRVYIPMSNSRLIHTVIREERRRATWTPQQKADYERLIKWLEDHGESVEKAREDMQRWDSWSRSSGEYRRKLDAEIAERKAEEAKAKQGKKE